MSSIFTVGGFYRNLTLDLEIAFIGVNYFYSLKLDLIYYIGRGDRVPNLTNVGSDIPRTPDKIGKSLSNLPFSSHWLYKYIHKGYGFYKCENFFDTCWGSAKKVRKNLADNFLKW